MWQSSETRLRKRLRRLIRVVEPMAREVNRLREENDQLRVAAALAVILALIMVVVVGVVVVGR